jgi:mono/diheme cytochrome c family protein
MGLRLMLLGAFSVLLSSVVLFGEASDLFEEQCAACHAKDGSGTPAGKKLGVLDLRSHEVQSLSDQDLFDSIGYGTKHKNYPHGFARRGLTNEQITGLVQYIRTLRK